jgi:hypothetical protein
MKLSAKVMIALASARVFSRRGSTVSFGRIRDEILAPAQISFLSSRVALVPPLCDQPPRYLGLR